MKKGILLGIMLLSLLVLIGGVNATGDVSITDVSTGLTVDPGQTASAYVTVVNMMVDTIPYVVLTSSDLVSVDGDIISAPSVNDVFNLNGTEQTSTFSISAGDLPAGVYSGNITAEESTDSANNDLVAYSVIVNAVTDFSLSTSSMTFTGQSDKTLTTSFTITNEGSVDLTGIVVTHNVNATDDDGDEINIDFKNVPSTIAVGGSGTIDVEVSIDDGVSLGEYDGQVDVTINGVTRQFDIKINVQPEICEDGVIGELEIYDIEEPGKGDDFDIGEEIEIEVEIKNHDDDDMDVIVEAILYNLNEDEEIESVESEEEEVEEGKRKTFKLKLPIPGDEDFDEDDDFVIYIKAYEDGGEDDHCAQDSVEIDLERQKNHIVITDVNVPSTINCGSLLEADVEIENWGTKDQDDVQVELYIPELDGFREKSAEYELEEYDGDDTDARVSFNVQIPKDAEEKEYSARFKAYFGTRSSEEKIVSFTVSGNCETTDDSDDGPKLGDASIALLESSFEAEAGEDLTIQVEVTNNKDSTESYVLSVDGLSGWGTTIGDQTVMMGAGQTRTAYVYLTIDEEIDAGRKGAVINVRENGNVVASQSISVEIPENAGAGEWFSDNSTMLWIIGYIVLIIVAIILIKVLFTKPKNKDTYYTESRVR